MEYKAQTKQCQNCKHDFTIEPEDFNFYEKIKVPPPTFCPECRLIRRFTWRNERSLYKRECGICKENIFSNFSQDSSLVVFCHSCWWGDSWNAHDFSQDFDFSRSFFEQFAEFYQKIPNLNLWGFGNGENVKYTNFTAYSKNILLSYSALYSEDILYSSIVDRSKNSIDCFKTKDSEFCYENIDTSKVYKSFFIIDSRDCIDSLFLYDCVNCQNCFMSSNLRNKQFYFRNKAFSREEYFKLLEELKIGSFEKLKLYKIEFKNLIENSLHKFSNVTNIVNSVGDNLSNTKNTFYTFNSWDTENVKYGWRVYEYKNSYDVSGSLKSELCYEVSTGADHNYESKFYTHSNYTNNLQYSHFCPNCSNCFACIGLRNKQYCILNKQYTKEEYEEMVPRIIQHMNDMPYIDSKGRIYKYGEFFPSELSPFAYNETIAQEYFPLTKEKALEQGYKWKDREERKYTIDIKTEDIPNDIKDVDDSILKKIIECSNNSDAQRGWGFDQDASGCTEAYKIIPQELQFYKRMNLPLPRFCPNCRHYNRLSQRNPLKLWHRKCMKPDCTNEFETSYSPDRPEIVYCEKCYQQEVY